jgi:hypothetical protein
MKKLILTIIVFAFIANVSAQIKINSSGNVGIGCEPTADPLRIHSMTFPTFGLQGTNSRLEIGASLFNGSFASFAKTGDIVYRALSAGPGSRPGLIFILPVTHNDGNFSIKFGDEANGGWFSIFNNRKVVIDGNVGIGRSPSYKLDVDGVIRVEQQVISSDERLKTEIKSLSNEKDKLYLLQGKSYKKTPPPTGITEVRYNEKGEELPSEERKIIEVSEYGYLAQELKKVFPELVVEGADGYSAVNYTGLIPIIVEALKEQKMQIEELRSEIKAINDVSNLRSFVDEQGEIDPVIARCKLYQNTPNPFDHTTQIRFYIPEEIKTAQLCVYNLQGKQIKQILITQRGEGSQLISGSKLNHAGMFLYALIVDGKEVDTKRMILTK